MVDSWVMSSSAQFDISGVVLRKLSRHNMEVENLTKSADFYRFLVIFGGILGDFGLKSPINNPKYHQK